MAHRVDLLGIGIDNLSHNEAQLRIDSLIRSGGSHLVVTPNVDHLIKLQKDREFRRIYQKASLILPDGQPLIWASRFLGTPLKQKISGSDLFPSLCYKSAHTRYRLFFLGGRPGAAALAAQRLRAKIPSIDIVGIHCPPYHFEHTPLENDKIIQLIHSTKPDIVFVGLGAPKQEKWIHAHMGYYQAPVSIGIGGSFEFLSGMVRRAPRWMQHTGMEWMWRLINEPRRLWKRYLVDDIAFFRLILKQKYSRIPPY